MKEDVLYKSNYENKTKISHFVVYVLIGVVITFAALYMMSPSH